MKTRAFKKAISVVCVLSMLLSLCVVSFVGTASAAGTDYTLNNNGVVYTLNLAKGAAIPAPTVPVEGVNFLGWYDDINFTNPVTVAGDDTTLFAKYDGVVATFDYTDANTNGIYDPNGKFGNNQFGAFKIVADPHDANNKVLLGDQLAGGKNTINTAIEAYPGSGKGVTCVADTQYIVSFRYMATKGTQPHEQGVKIGTYVSKQEGIGNSGSKQAIATAYFDYTDDWAIGNLSFTLSAANVTSYPYLLFTVGDGNYDRGKVYIDDIVINVANDQNYTLNNKGEEVVMTAKPGDKLPHIATASFIGWYDATLSNKYTSYPLVATKLFAKYDGTTANIDTGVFKPNATNDLYMSVVADPLDANNKVVATVPAKDGNNVHFAPLGAAGATEGLKLVPGKVYTVRFDYLAQNIGSKKAVVSVRAASKAGIGTNGGKTAQMSSFDITANTTEWTEASFNFTFNGTEDMPYLIFLAQQDVLPQTASVYFDNIVIKPYVPQVVVEDYVMDFEDVDNNGFEWSVDANDYTYNTGNGYVTRGEILANEDNTNKFFKLTHSKSKNGHHYFTVNNGADQLAVVNGGIYTVEFDYFVEHSETPTKLNLYYVNTDGKGAVKTITVIDEFDYRDDDAAKDWAHAKYTFIATSDAETYSSIGIGMSNTTNCPEEFATAVFFDNVRVQTHSTTGEDAIIVFDSNGGDECESIAVEVGRKPADLPAPTKYGYDFAGWKYDVTTGEGEEAVTTTYDLTTSTIMPAGIMNAYAAWNLKAGVIELSFRTNVEEYDANVGKIVAFPGKPIIGMPANPEYDNQTFVGWYLDRNFNKALNVNSAPSTGLTLFAKWKTDGIVIDYEDYSITDTGRKSDRYKIITEENGNKVLSHSLEYGTNKNSNAVARAMFQDAGKVIRAYEGAPYVVKFKYKVEDFKTQGRFYIFLSNKANTWEAYKQQSGSVAYNDNTNGWAEGVIEFDATLAADATSNDNYMAIGCNGDATLYIDDVVISCPENDMNIYGSAIRFNVNGGKAVNAISGDEGDTIVLPTPKKNGYKFIGWYTDNTFATKFTDTKFGAEPILLHAKWQLGKFEENFENYPSSVATLGIAAGYTLYTNTAVGFDSSNIRGGSFSVFRNGATAGVKVFTLMRSMDYALDVGETYTMKVWVKPTAISVDTGYVSLVSMSSFTGINVATEIGNVVKYSDLKEGEWQQVSYTFVATTPFVGIGTTVGCDMYFDDASITLKGYTGSASTDSAPTGDSSVSPIIILAVILLSAGALLITGKKVFAK